MRVTERMNVREISRFHEKVEKGVHEIGKCTFMQIIGELEEELGQLTFSENEINELLSSRTEKIQEGVDLRNVECALPKRRSKGRVKEHDWIMERDLEHKRKGRPNR